VRALLLPLLLGLAACTSAPPPALPEAPASPLEEETVDLSAHFAGLEGATFVLLDPEGGRLLRHDPERSREGFLPASTFKIANALVALDAGVPPDFSIPWDSTLAPREDWWPEAWARPSHTLASAFQPSVVWYYQALARQTGEARLAEALRQWGYGNAETSGGVDLFWLTGGLRISAEEQVSFLQRLYEGDLLVSPEASETLRALMVLEEGEGYRLSGKTGTARLENGRLLGWLVGVVERGGEVYPYALNVEGPSEAVWGWGNRTDRVKAILSELGVLP
jgi:beta-lactamase class D